MISFDDIVNENKTLHNKNWPYVPDHPYRILIIGGSGSGKTNALINLINEKKWYWQNLFISKRFKWT